MRRIVVLGGSGFVGQALVDLLLGAGHEVLVVSRQAANTAVQRPGLGFMTGAVADAGQMRRAIEGADAVYHLATGGGNAWTDFERDFVRGTHNVADACFEHGVRRLIYTSSIAALYLGTRGPINQDGKVDSHSLRRSHYSRAKIAAEEVLADLRATKELPVVILRPGVVMGRGGTLNHGGIGQWPVDTCCVGWGRGNTPLPFVLVSDVAEALVAALDAPGIEGQAFNLAGDVWLSAREFVDILATRSVRNFRFYPQSLIKMQLLEIGKWLLKCAARKPDNSFPSFHDMQSRTLRSQLDCSAAKRLLNWRPNDRLEVFIREAIDVHLEQIPDGDLRLTYAG
jgi:nucleoside-diphosphate-sugar epimerase